MEQATLEPIAYTQSAEELSTQHLVIGSTEDSNNPLSGSPIQCQVVGCLADLRSTKAYCIKKRLCPAHLAADAVLRRGCGRQLWRFCQQCGKLEHLELFEGIKRSCRQRLQKRRANSAKKICDVKIGTQSLKTKKRRGKHSYNPDYAEGYAHIEGVEYTDADRSGESGTESADYQGPTIRYADANAMAAADMAMGIKYSADGLKVPLAPLQGSSSQLLQMPGAILGQETAYGQAAAAATMPGSNAYVPGQHYQGAAQSSYPGTSGLGHSISASLKQQQKHLQRVLSTDTVGSLSPCQQQQQQWQNGIPRVLSGLQFQQLPQQVQQQPGVYQQVRLQAASLPQASAAAKAAAAAGAAAEGTLLSAAAAHARLQGLLDSMLESMQVTAAGVGITADSSSAAGKALMELLQSLPGVAAGAAAGSASAASSPSDSLTRVDSGSTPKSTAAGVQGLLSNPKVGFEQTLGEVLKSSDNLQQLTHAAKATGTKAAASQGPSVLDIVQAKLLGGGSSTSNGATVAASTVAGQQQNPLEALLQSHGLGHILGASNNKEDNSVLRINAAGQQPVAHLLAEQEQRLQQFETAQDQLIQQLVRCQPAAAQMLEACKPGMVAAASKQHTAGTHGIRRLLPAAAAAGASDLAALGNTLAGQSLAGFPGSNTNTSTAGATSLSQPVGSLPTGAVGLHPVLSAGLVPGATGSAVGLQPAAADPHLQARQAVEKLLVGPQGRLLPSQPAASGVAGVVPGSSQPLQWPSQGLSSPQQQAEPPVLLLGTLGPIHHRIREIYAELQQIEGGVPGRLQGSLANIGLPAQAAQLLQQVLQGSLW